MFRPNHLKDRLLSGEIAYGCWVAGGAPTNAEILGHAGYDFVLADYEHGLGDTQAILETLRALETTPSPVVVRVPWNDHVLLKRIIDASHDKSRFSIKLDRQPRLVVHLFRVQRRVSKVSHLKPWLMNSHAP